ncbi:MAG: hypothetical protein ABIN36_16070 [Ferruginibacter sp.]
MTATFESEKNRKAFIYTAIICIGLLLLFILISWKVLPPTVPVVQDLMEINLGNNDEGFGEEQPLKKGNRTPSQETIPETKQVAAAQAAQEEKVNPDDNAEENAATVNKPVKNITKTKTADIPVVAPAPKPQKPKITYNGPATGPPGNNPTQDNGYTMQGNKPNGKNDDGVPDGNKDSYGNTTGGKVGVGQVTKGNRKIVYRSYNFTGELQKATIFAIVKVSAAGKGTFVGFDKGSTNRSQPYADAIRNYLRTMEFNKADDESTVTVQFNFNIN